MSSSEDGIREILAAEGLLSFDDLLRTIHNRIDLDLAAHAWAREHYRVHWTAYPQKGERGEYVAELGLERARVALRHAIGDRLIRLTLIAVQLGEPDMSTLLAAATERYVEVAEHQDDR